MCASVCRSRGLNMRNIIIIKTMRLLELLTLLHFLTAASGALGRNYIPKAKNVTWTSHNFKTILNWGPKPSNYSYTVEFSGIGSDRQRNPHCIRTSATECDLTSALTELKVCYTAEVLSEAPTGTTSDLLEPPSTQSKKFCPYTDTVLGAPEFRVLLDENNTITLLMQQQLTALYTGDQPQTLRDIFNNDLHYKILYRKVGNTGEKEKIVSQDVEKMSELDKGESYCFRAAVFIPSRKGSKKMSRWSVPKCSPGGNRSLIDEYGLGVLGGAALLLMVLLIIIIVSTVVCCKQRRREKKMEKEGAVTEV